MRRTPRPLHEFVTGGPAARVLLDRLSRNRELLAAVRALLPPDLAGHCVAALLDEGRLLLYADASAWASRLRFHSRELVRELARAGVPTGKINVRVLIEAQPRRSPPPRRVRRLSKKSAALIRQTAEHLPDPALAAALLRLAARGR